MAAATRTAAAPATPVEATREEATREEARTRRPRPEAATVGVPPPADQSAELKGAATAVPARMTVTIIIDS